MRKIAIILYELIMILLVILTILTIWTENTYNSAINWIVWAVFFGDFLFRFFLAKGKWQFIKRNPFLILAIIPFDQFFQIARIVRLIYFFRIKQIAKYYITPYTKKLTYQSFSLIVIIITSLLISESFIVWKLEFSIQSFLEGVYVVFGHLLFFGHHIFIIKHTISIWLLTITSIIGIVLQGLALQWLFTKFELIYRKLQRDTRKAS